MVEHHDERVAFVGFGVFLGIAKNVFEARIAIRARFGHHALMASAFAQLVELAARDGLHRHVELTRLAQDVFDLAVLLQVIGHQNAFDRHLRAQRLDDRSLALDIVWHGIPIVSSGCATCALSACFFSAPLSARVREW